MTDLMRKRFIVFGVWKDHLIERECSHYHMAMSYGFLFSNAEFKARVWDRKLNRFIPIKSFKSTVCFRQTAFVYA